MCNLQRLCLLHCITHVRINVSFHTLLQEPLMIGTEEVLVPDIL